jgi:hypothetical protein
MLIGPGHPDWNRLIVGLYQNHPWALTSPNRLVCLCIIMDWRDKWYTPEIIEYYDHYGGG